MTAEDSAFGPCGLPVISTPVRGTGPDLRQYRFHQILTVPRRTEDPRETDRTPAQLTAAVTAAHAILGLQPSDRSAGFAVIWARPRVAQPLRFLAGGQPHFPPAGSARHTDGFRRPLLYPPGATAQDVETKDVTDLLATFPFWLRCSGIHDALLLRNDERSLPAGNRGSFDDSVAHLPDPFAWLVIAQPVPPERIEHERSSLATQIPRLRQRENSAPDRLALERAEGRHRELTRSLGTGMWEVHVLVGAQQPAQAHAAAALLCGASDLNELPYHLTPGRTPASLAQVLNTHTTQDTGTSPFTASAELVAALARPPARELPGIRTPAPNRFDVTPEHASDDGFLLGDILDEALTPISQLHIPRATLNRHTFVCGATGSGKSQTVRTLLTALSTHPDPVPWLVIEPAKAEYARMAGRLGPSDRVTVIRPGDPDVLPASLNPLEPEPGFPLQSHVDLVRALFLAAFEGHEPLPQILARALTHCYTAAGWDLITSTPRPAYKPKFHLYEPDQPRHARYPTLGDLQTTAQKVVEAIGYGKEITADVRGFIDVRIGSLREGTPGRFFEGGHPLDIAGLIAGNVVLELEALTNDQDKAFLIGTVLIRLIEHLRVHHNNSTTLRHVTVIEEAHRLLKNVHDGPAAAAVELFASLLAEIRAYGEGITVVEQIPSKILPDVVKNSALKIMHRLPAADDRQMVGATINLQDHQSENVVSLLPGQAATASDGMDRPVLLRVAHNEQCENASAANTDPPLLASRSPLCGSACRQRPCTLRAMNDAYHHSTEPILVMWVEAAASAQAMAMTPPDPAPALRQRLSPLTDRDLDCTFAYAVERAVAARESHMRSDVDPQDFATHLHTLLSHRLGHSPAPAPIDARCLAYGSYRWRDVLLTVMAAVKDGTDTVPRQYPETEEWAARGLVFTTSTPAEQERELLNRPCYAADRADGPVGDTTRSGIREAVIALTVGTTATHIDTAFRLACTGPHLDTVLERVVEQVAQQFKIGPG